MRKSAYRTIRRTGNSADAQMLIGVLRSAGLHPVDLLLAAPLALPGEHPTYPVQVPNEEAEAAERILDSAIDKAA